MADWRYEEHLRSPVGHDELPDGGHDGAAGGAACGDLVRIRVEVAGDKLAGVGFLADGCGALTVCASVVCEEVADATIREAARVSVASVSEAVGGLHPGKLHAAELVVDAFHRALGAAVAHDAVASLPEGGPSGTLVAMSGGVDSAVAALEAGPDAVAVTLELWRDEQNDAESSCCSHSAVRRARDVAHGIGLPHLTLDLREQFRSGVVEPWVAEHRQGLTPNPCVRCNGDVRLDAMLDLADRIGCATLTTGHYARTTGDGLLRLAVDTGKDQAYMLSALRPSSIARMRFPLGGLTKPEVREMADRAGLSVARQPDSQDLCFLAGTGQSQFLARHGDLDEKPGPVHDIETGATIGEHRGAHLYTLGQRRGLGVAAGEPRYVITTDVDSNVVTVGRREHLMTDRVTLRDVVLHREPWRVDGVKLRYRQQPRRARILEAPETGATGPGTVMLEEPLLRAAPGQTAMLLDGDVVVGTGTLV